MQHTIRCVFIGTQHVGKSTLLDKCSRIPRRSGPTIGIDNVLFQHKNIQFQCWDCSGSKQFEAVVKLFIQKANHRVYVYNTNDRQTYKPDEIPENALIVANIKANKPPIDQSHIPVSINDQNSIDHLLDIMIHRFEPEEPPVIVHRKRDCCICF